MNLKNSFSFWSFTTATVQDPTFIPVMCFYVLNILIRCQCRMASAFKRASALAFAVKNSEARNRKPFSADVLNLKKKKIIGASICSFIQQIVLLNVYYVPSNSPKYLVTSANKIIKNLFPGGAQILLGKEERGDKQKIISIMSKLYSLARW